MLHRLFPTALYLAVALTSTFATIARATDSSNLLESLARFLKPKVEAKQSEPTSRNLNVIRSDKRVALVIGNGAYADSPLRNPVNDAKDMAEALRKLGFDVIEKTDANQRDMNRAITQFGDKLRADTVALFFYAGHGMQVKGKNYIIPVDAKITGESSVRAETVDVDTVMDQLSVSPMNIVILDACRNNPFERRFRTVGGGLAQMDAPKGSLIAYATAPGKTAADGDGRNGLYTQELLKNIQTPGLPLEAVFKRVRNGVMAASGDAQTPWESSSLTGDFYFISTGTTNVQAQHPADPEAETWAAAESTKTVNGYQSYLVAYPNGRYTGAAKIKLDALLKPIEQPAKAEVFTQAQPAQVPAKADVPEMSFWNEVKANGTREYLDAYVKQYPKGTYLALAKLEIKKLEDQEKAERAKEETEKQEAEQIAWNDAKTGKSVASFSSYLERYPKGRYATLAQTEVKRLQRNSVQEVESYLDAGEAALKRGDYLEGFENYRKAANHNSAVGQSMLGTFYASGKGVDKDLVEAVKWFRKSANQGNAGGQILLGKALATGNGVPRDDVEAFKLFRKAADQGSTAGQYYVGSAYEYGRGVTKDDVEAAKWYRKSAVGGNEMGQVFLGLSYMNGNGVPKDVREAAKWFLKAAELGEPMGQFLIASAYQNGSGVAKDEVEAVKWYRKSAEQSNHLGQFGLGYMYQMGLGGLPANKQEARRWYSLAAKQGNATASENLRSLDESIRSEESAWGVPVALEWAKEDNGGSNDWNDAVRYCASKGDGWRLPTPAELKDSYKNGKVASCGKWMCKIASDSRLSGPWFFNSEPNGAIPMVLGPPPMSGSGPPRALCTRSR